MKSLNGFDAPVTLKEYPVFKQPRESSGSTLLTFDNEGVLWVTMSYSHAFGSTSLSDMMPFSFKVESLSSFEMGSCELSEI